MIFGATRTFIFMTAALLGIFYWFANSESEQFPVMLPLALILLGAVGFWLILWKRERNLPLFEVGTIFMAALLFYSAVPLIQFLVIGGYYSGNHALQLYLLSPDLREVASLAWYYVIHLYAFATAYLLVRGYQRMPQPDRLWTSKETLLALVVIYVVLESLFIVYELNFGVDYSSSYNSVELKHSRAVYTSLPYILQQTLPMMASIKFLTTISLLAVLIANWHSAKFRVALKIWVLVLVTSHVVKLGARTELILILLALFLLYHRFVRPVKIAKAVGMLVILTCIFFILGFARGAGNSTISGTSFSESGLVAALDTMNEFEHGFAGALHLNNMVDNGIISDIPWQVRATEILAIIPQQLLPFEKVDAQKWYSNYGSIDFEKDFPGYFMMNPIAQSVIGWGWFEVMLRGFLLGVIMAMIHRWFLRHSKQAIAVFFYLNFIVWSYYSIRSSSFGFVKSIIFIFLPFVVSLNMIERILHGVAMKKSVGPGNNH